MPMEQLYLILVLGFLVGRYLLDTLVEWRNVRHVSTELPREFAGVYDPDKYRTSQRYLKENTGFSVVKDTVSTVIIVAVILCGGFGLLDRGVRALTENPLAAGLFFAGVVFLLSEVMSLPFRAYHTFVIEEKYGFNKTKVRTFIGDFVKELFLGVVLGGMLFAGVLWFFLSAGAQAWLWCWAAVMVFQLFVTFIAPVVILPLFNKFVPLPEGELRNAIEEYARSQDFRLQGVYTMDASRRSTKSNAFFTGLGKYKRIALFDTLIEKLNVPELVSVLAHEVGHYKKKHILKGIILSAATTGVMFYILQFFIGNRDLAAAFGVEQASVYASIIFFGFLYTPLSVACSIIAHTFSRRYEYEADRFAAVTYGHEEDFISALKKLTVENLSNLTPHPWKVRYSYSHPPVLNRIRALRELAAQQQKIT
ncbi:MAG: M48 family metalloprotease [Candidatus Omnitrophica bacterium]|nr:M48 family metalloprotease [Candidatus Omnitrophota bacterium]